MNSIAPLDEQGGHQVENRQFNHPQQFVSTVIVVGTADLDPLFKTLGEQLPTGQGLPMLLIGSILFDLLLRTQALELQSQELAQHMEVELEERLQWPHGVLWYTSEGLHLLEELYGTLRNLVWPQLLQYPDSIDTAVFQRLTGTMMELSIMRRVGQP